MDNTEMNVNEKPIGSNKTEFSYDYLIFMPEKFHAVEKNLFLKFGIYVGIISILLIALDILIVKWKTGYVGAFFLSFSLLCLIVYNLLRKIPKQQADKLVDSHNGMVQNLIFYNEYFIDDTTYNNGNSYRKFEYRNINKIFCGDRYISFLLNNETIYITLDKEGFDNIYKEEVIEKIKAANNDVKILY